MTDRERFYDSIAEDFDQIMDPYDLDRRLWVVFGHLLEGVDLRGLRVLDAGCGTGAFSLAAIERGGEVVSLDLGMNLVRVAGKKGSSRGVAGSVLDLPFGDGTFDVVISSEVVEHTPSPKQAVGELVRVLRPGGRLALTCPNRFWHWSVRLAGLLRIRPYQGLENWPRWRELAAWVEGAGVDVLRHRGLHLFPFQLSVSHGLLTRLDGRGDRWGKVYVNQCLAGIKRGA